jgi:phospholipid-binding lipoprotein MlaA
MNYRTVRNTFCLVIAMVLIGCSSVSSDSDSNDDASTNDPLESVNRASWSLNYDYLDPYVIRPVSLAYVNNVPKPLRYGIANFLANLDEPANMLNNLFMGNGHKALDHFNRFWINSTFGIFGLFDIASAAGIYKEDNKGFGDVLGHYGVGNGPYLMVPAYGPYSPRETADLVDATYLPLSYLNIWTGLGKFIFQGMEKRASFVSQEATLKRSPDPYALTRGVYFQHQNFKAEIKENDQQDDPEQEALYDQYLK